MNQSKHIIQSWHDNAAAWTLAVREDKIASRKLVTNKAVVEAVLQGGAAKVLDAGCGEGWLCRTLSSKGIAMTGIDVSTELIAAATAQGHARYLTIGYEQFCENPKQCGHDFDAIVFNFSLLEEAIVPVLSAARSILTPEGRIVIQTVHPFTACGDAAYENGWRVENFSAFGTLFPTPMPWYFRTVTAWLEAIQAAGLTLKTLLEPLHPETARPASLILGTKKG